MIWIMFFFGLFLGGTFGCLAMAMAAAARDVDQFEKGYYQGIRKSNYQDIRKCQEGKK